MLSRVDDLFALMVFKMVEDGGRRVSPPRRKGDGLWLAKTAEEHELERINYSLLRPPDAGMREC